MRWSILVPGKTGLILAPGHFACTVRQQMKLHRKTPSAHNVGNSGSSASAASDQASAKDPVGGTILSWLTKLSVRKFTHAFQPLSCSLFNCCIHRPLSKCCARYRASHLTRSTSHVCAAAKVRITSFHPVHARYALCPRGSSCSRRCTTFGAAALRSVQSQAIIPVEAGYSLASYSATSFTSQPLSNLP